MRSAPGGPLAVDCGPRRPRAFRALTLALAAPGLTACTAALDSPRPPGALWSPIRYGPERTRLNDHDRWPAVDQSELLPASAAMIVAVP